MAIILGVDTGGTYTDAVLIRDDREVLATAKSLTTRHDLAIGIGSAVQSVLDTVQVAPQDIGLASLSTTLATNALVEGQGGRVGLIYIGFRDRDLDHVDLKAALSGDPAIAVVGGHDHAGSERAVLDKEAIAAFVRANTDVSGWAVAAQFATRNPAHERMTADLIARETGAAVTCSHELSARLNGPKRAVTAVLNARLIGMIHKLIGRAQDSLAEIGITSPLMVVRGDGALMSAQQAQTRPIETILSGPAASIVGAKWLTGADDAIVSDIGGTTTDVALIQNGRPALDPAGAQVGGHRTMVEAVAMRTTGLGGDSEVHLMSQGLSGGLDLGPRRVLPVSLAAQIAPEVVHDALDRQLRSPVPGEHDGRFLVPGTFMEETSWGPREKTLLERLGQNVRPLNEVLRNRVESGALSRLVNRGAVQLAGPTPSDAAHVAGMLNAWDASAASKALSLLARRRIGSGELLASDAEKVAQMIIDQMTAQTSIAILETVFAEEAAAFGATPAETARSHWLQRALTQHTGLISVKANVSADVIGLGASAPHYYPAVGRHLGCKMILPEHAGVANAIGAVVGQITVRRSGTITAPSEGCYRVHLTDGPQDFADPEAALQMLKMTLKSSAKKAAASAGAIDLSVNVDENRRVASVEGKTVLVEAQVTVEASGRPGMVAT